VSITDATVLDPRIDRRLAVDIDAAESDVLTAYWDPIGKVWTCGRGHVMPPPAPPATWAGFSVIQSTSDRWFNTDIVNAMVLAQKWPEYEKCDTACRKNALIEIAFNLGGRWAGFHHARAAALAQDWQGVHDNLLWDAPGVKTAWYAEVKGRAERLANYFLTGEYPCQSGT
jgi:GH24 family phage-related lysozyme (muramidase)